MLILGETVLYTHAQAMLFHVLLVMNPIRDLSPCV